MLKRILVADGDAHERKMTRCFLESRTSCEVCGEAANDIDALEKAETLHPDLILLDYSMPVLGGIEIGAVLRVILPEVPVILFAGQDTGAIEPAAISVGIRVVVPKTDVGRLAGQLAILFESPSCRFGTLACCHILVRRLVWT
jgi:DNA-binding NarL/FixJ family response regulator